MPAPLPAGPYRVVDSPDAGSVPYYVIPFDADGGCEGPLTRQHLLDHVAGYSDVFVFSHGWNNDWTAATERYESFIRGVQQLRRDLHLAPPPGYKPLLVGIFWPSQPMAWLDSEKGPGFAAVGDPAAQDRATETDRAVLRDIAAALPAGDRERFFGLMQAETLDEAGARALATLLARLAHPDDEGLRDGAPDAGDLLASAQALQAAQGPLDDGQVGTVTGGGAAAEPGAAFGLGSVFAALDPRNLVKPFTVWQMKDRAGRVGHEGVGPLLQALLKRSSARVHLLGHSYGCKVVMTALCAPDSLPRPVESALLLQPAISQYAFAERVPERDRPGGFFRALERVRLPIAVTYSAEDVALHDMFHLSVRRKEDLGELQFAGEGSSPSRYAAMGGYGPQEARARWIAMQPPGTEYAFAGASRVLALNGTRFIGGHGEISNPATWWLSTELVGAHARGD
jgi:hypothetical protein